MVFRTKIEIKIGYVIVFFIYQSLKNKRNEENVIETPMLEDFLSDLLREWLESKLLEFRIEIENSHLLCYSFIFMITVNK